MQNLKIKSMKLYNHVERIYNELREIGKNNSEPLDVEELINFDQLHYRGIEAVDFAINKIGIDSNMKILEIGSGIGGPARYIANKTGSTVIALELQPDQNKIAADLTKRCGLSKKVIHICGDFLTYNWEGQTFDAIVSWLSLYHISDHEALLKNCFDLLNLNGSFYIEDLIRKEHLSNDESSELSKEIFAKHLSNYQSYISNIEKKGFKLMLSQDMSDDWTSFTKDRILSYHQNWNRNIRIHGKDIVKNLNIFYSIIDHYFSSRKLGGIRIFATKI